MCQSHFGRSTTGNKFRFKKDVTSHVHGILQIAFNFVKDVLGSSTQQDSASLGIFTFHHEAEVLITNLEVNNVNGVEWYY